MRTHRNLPTIGLIVVAMVGLAACVAINETLTDRDIDCTTAPDDVCLRMVDLAETEIAAELVRQFPGVDLEIIVRAAACPVGPVKQVGGRCWEVAFMAPDGAAMGLYFLEDPDGTLTRT